MAADDFKQGMMEMYQGEVIGEVLFNRMLGIDDDTMHRYKVAVMLQLETETKARLRPWVMRLGLDPAELEESRDTGHAFADNLSGLGWDETLLKLCEGIKPYVERYREIEAIAPPEYADAAHSMVVHEQSLYRFTELEAAGDVAHSLDDIVAQLVHLLPAPAGV
jgi:hypothetical protein